jgi:inorganic triphosphatase YgiF
VLAEVALDGVSVLEGERVAGGFDELEIELFDGSEDDLRALEKVLRGAGAKDAPSSTKLGRVLGVEPARRTKLGSGATPDQALRAALRDQLALILAHYPGTRLGTDVEDLHQLRVATRRLRAFLRASRRFGDDHPRSGPRRARLVWARNRVATRRRDRAPQGSASLGATRRRRSGPSSALAVSAPASGGRLLRGLESDRYLALDRLELVET